MGHTGAFSQIGSRMRESARWLTVGWGLVASPVLAESVHPDVSVGLTAFQYLSYARASPPFQSLEVAYHRPVGAEGLWRALRVGGGLRAGLPSRDVSLPLEAYVQVELATRFGPWSAAVGPELGVSGFAHLASSPLSDSGVYVKDSALLGPVYFALGAAPLRFHFNGFVINALEIHLGTTSPAPGVVTRIQVNFLSVGLSL